MTAQHLPVVGIDAQPSRLILCALMWASPAQVLEALELLEVDDFTTPHTEILDAIRRLAEHGKSGAQAVLSELMRTGDLNGPIRREMESAPFAGGVLEGVRDYYTAYLATVFRDRAAAHGRALADASETSPEGELWAAVLDGGRELRRVATRLEQLRGGAL